MLHPALETVLFLKIARNNICESIKRSDIEEKEELVSYIQNEASDYEVMHVTVLGEMPEEKFDPVLEEEVWDLFRKEIVAEFNNLVIEEGYDPEDINRMIFEMGPVSELGLSSAKPIMEFQRNNGTYDKIVSEGIGDSIGRGFRKMTGRSTMKDKAYYATQDAKKKYAAAKKKFDTYSSDAKKKISDKAAAAKAAASKGVETAKQKGADATAAAKQKYASLSPNQQKALKYGAAGAAGAAAAYGAYKLYKKFRGKKDKDKKDKK